MNPNEMQKNWYGRHTRHGSILPIDDPAAKSKFGGGFVHSYVLGDPKDGRILGNITCISEGESYTASGWATSFVKFDTYEEAKEYVETQTAEPEIVEDICRVIDAGWDLKVSKLMY